MSLPFENELQRELARVRRQREGGQQRDLSVRMDTPTFSPAGVGSPTAPPPDLSTMTDMVAELTQPVNRAQMDHEIEDFNLTYPVNVDDALEAFTLQKQKKKREINKQKTTKTNYKKIFFNANNLLKV